MSDPHLVLLDEPVAGLNNQETAHIARHIRQKRSAGHTMLLVEHDMELVMDVADHVVVLDSGRLIASGTPAAVQKQSPGPGSLFGKHGGDGLI